MLLIQLGLFVILIALSGFFSNSGTSLFSLNETQIEQMRWDEDPQLSLIERLLGVDSHEPIKRWRCPGLGEVINYKEFSFTIMDATPPQAVKEIRVRW